MPELPSDTWYGAQKLHSMMENDDKSFLRCLGFETQTFGESVTDILNIFTVSALIQVMNII